MKKTKKMPPWMGKDKESPKEMKKKGAKKGKCK
jgi:hypothetical protein